VIDFNLMFKESHDASMKAVTVTNDLDLKNEHTTILYAFESDIIVKIHDQVFNLKKGELLVVNEHCILSVETENTKIIVCKIKNK